MVQVSIDVPALRGVISDLNDAVDLALEEWSAVAGAAGRALADAPSLSGLGEHTMAITEAASDLQARVDLAVLVNGGDENSWDGPVSFDVLSDSSSSIRGQIGTELANALGDIPSGSHGREDVEHLADLAEMLDRYHDDELVTNAMFEELGPEGALRVPAALHYFEDNYSRNQMAMTQEDLFWDDDTPMHERIREIQQDFMENYGAALATSSHSDQFDPDFADGLVSAVTEDRTTLGWGMSQIFRHGDYEADFLSTVGTGLYEWEKQQPGRVWGGRFNGELDGWTLGTGDGEGYYDPFVGLFEAMGRTPEGALEFIHDEERAQYIIEERTWAHDDFNSLGIMLDAAATSFRDPDDPRSEQAAWVAAATVHHLGERDGDPAIGDAGKDSLGHILATYIADVDRIANDRGGGFGILDPSPANDPWDLGLPARANFEYENLRNVMQEVLTDDTALAQVANASAEWNAYRMGMAAGGDGEVQAAVNQSGALDGFVMGTMDVGREDAARDADARAQMYLDITSDVAGLVPTGGTFTSFLASQAIKQGSNAAASQFTNNLSRVQEENHTVAEVAQIDLQIAMASELAENDRIPPDAMKDQDGATYPWFENGTFDADVLADEGMRDRFIGWMRSSQVGDDTAALIPDLDGQFDDGFDRGRG